MAAFAYNSGGAITPDVYSSWLSHERDNGYKSGEAAALGGDSGVRSAESGMPIGIKSKFTPEQWAELVRVRGDNFRQGFASVKRFVVTAYSKKEAESLAGSLKRNGHSVLGITKVKVTHGFVFEILCATTARQLPYGAKQQNPASGRDILYETKSGHFWVRRGANSFEVYRNDAVASTRVAQVGMSLGLDRAIEEANRREALPSNDKGSWGYWNRNVRNPAVSGAQYRAAQAVLSGRSSIIPVNVARELIEKTPGNMRGEFMRNGIAGSYRSGSFVAFGGRPMDKRKQALKEAQQLYKMKKDWDGRLLTASELEANKQKAARIIASMPNPTEGELSMIETIDNIDSIAELAFSKGLEMGRELNELESGESTPAEIAVEENPSFSYQVRFIRPNQAADLVNLYHLARVPLSGKHGATKYDQMLWASSEFHKAHPEVSATGAYKDLDGLLAHGTTSLVSSRRRGRRNPLPSNWTERTFRSVMTSSQKNYYKSGVAWGRKDHKLGRYQPAQRMMEEHGHGKHWEAAEAFYAGYDAGYGSGNYWAEVEAERGRHRNPEESATDLYESFHGAPPTEILEYHTEEHEHTNYAGLGDLIELKVITPYGKEVTLACADPATAPLQDVIKLCSSEDGKQLYFVGGDQGIDLKAAGFKDSDEKDCMVLGVLHELTYRTAKKFHKFKLTDYFHRLGEESGEQPMLIFYPLNPSIAVAGGAYEVKDVGIVN